MEDSRPVRRRSALVQERSRHTRQQLVRAALQLWAQRGFETGIEATTVDEIVTTAGVTKGTFYFYFSSKEEILLEMGWDTALVVAEDVRCSLDSDRGLEESLGGALGALVRHVSNAPPQAVGRAASQSWSTRASSGADEGRPTFAEPFEALFARAFDRGELVADVGPRELAEMLQAVVMESILDWAAGDADLDASLRRRAGLLLAGARPPSHDPLPAS